ncbi:hypothetical protein Kpol_1036p27 [Vanderwaltozyma polyspora DSM 70294]|uniref:Galactokinase n=1 Tax=Vanderwaltozyma polyspora (strain ATCC 22028 / DSM 70294 / BCRC 21397 / CBS 2163 / NBRC 10782 / NRRL Y-8283 / UCD 57-17) TaxID=436907 RepID=A7TEH8_VANPO|nr:uncharacterized protein Kpol_1036p27 [Vanderwaltozyma polyspora DSM 70294]EDO19285.1 hypothetical protein Kpol_1036p27 [Vanderwaltozyma polyspora DSM 70294]
MDVPVFTLSNCSGSTERITEKCLQVIEKFQNIYNQYPDFISRSPGRVNIIGEHIDYENFAVLPMAIERSIYCAVKVINDDFNPSITLYNNNSGLFAERMFGLPLDGSYVDIDPSISDWSNYFRCGLNVAQKFLKHLNPNKYNNSPLLGLKVFVQGDIPHSGGLSSSAAFICSVALLIIRANMGPNYSISKNILSQITMSSEHYLGVSTGSMDQIVSINGLKDHLLYLQFRPIMKTTPIQFPFQNVQFIIADTLVSSNKLETASTNYNLRVIEDSIAANVLASKFGLFIGKRTSTFKFINNNGNGNGFGNGHCNGGGHGDKGNLRDFMEAYCMRQRSKSWDGDINVGIEMLQTMLEIIDQCFPNNRNQWVEGYTIDEVAQLLNISRNEIASEYLTIYPVRFQTLKLYQRAKHVYSEALRVLRSVELLSNHEMNEFEFCSRFGELMNESQKSCELLYECSCEEIEEICTIARLNGSIGSRLTGAGWGGSTIHMVPGGIEQGERVKEALINNYYIRRYPHISKEELANAIIFTSPAMGSCIYEL